MNKIKKVITLLILVLANINYSLGNSNNLISREIKDIKEAKNGFNLYLQLHRNFRTMEQEVGKGLQVFNDRLEKALNNNYKLIYFYTKDQKELKNPVGILGFSIRNELYWGKYMWIDSLIVDPKFRRQGIAKEMMIYAENYAKNEHLTSVQLETGKARSEAKEFYDKIGYDNATIGYRKLIE